LRRQNKLAVLAIVLILAGLVLISIAFSEVSQSNSILNQTINVNIDSPYTSFAVSASYYLSGNHNGKISGTLHSANCCIDFLIFTDTAWSNWRANGMKATNASNSPALAIDYNLIKTAPSNPAVFSFIPDPNTIYSLAFFNNNRSQWNTNSSVAMHVFADIVMSYTNASARFLEYPGVALVLAGIVVIIWTYRFLR
jgi:hypothetical protein